MFGKHEAGGRRAANFWYALAAMGLLGVSCFSPTASATEAAKIAVFPFELEDFSAAGEVTANPAEAGFLAQSTDEARSALTHSGRYDIVDTAGADISDAEGHGLRNCRGCEAVIARKLGADEALVGVITKVSMTEYSVRIQITDARNGTVVSSFTTDLRMGANYSWSRGVRWLMQNRVLASK